MAMTMIVTKIDPINNIYSAQDSLQGAGAAALAETLAPGSPFALKSIKLHLSAAGGTSEDFTATMDNDLGAAFDTNLLTVDTLTLISLWLPYGDNENRFKADDEIDFAYNNANTRTYGLEVIYRLI